MQSEIRNPVIKIQYTSAEHSAKTQDLSKYFWSDSTANILMDLKLDKINLQAVFQQDVASYFK